MKFERLYIADIFIYSGYIYIINYSDAAADLSISCKFIVTKIRKFIQP